MKIYVVLARIIYLAPFIYQFSLVSATFFEDLQFFLHTNSAIIGPVSFNHAQRIRFVHYLMLTHFFHLFNVEVSGSVFFDIAL